MSTRPTHTRSFDVAVRAMSGNPAAARADTEAAQAVIVIGISGPSASGKSFLATNLAETLSPGSTCTVIPLDRWNRDRQCPPHAKYTPTGGMITHRLGKEMCEGPEGFPWAVIVETVNAAVQTARSTGQRYVIVEGLYPYYNAGLDALMDIRFELTPKMAVRCRTQLGNLRYRRDKMSNQGVAFPDWSKYWTQVAWDTFNRTKRHASGAANIKWCLIETPKAETVASCLATVRAHTAPAPAGPAATTGGSSGRGRTATPNPTDIAPGRGRAGAGPPNPQHDATNSPQRGVRQGRTATRVTQNHAGAEPPSGPLQDQSPATGSRRTATLNPTGRAPGRGRAGAGPPDPQQATNSPQRGGPPELTAARATQDHAGAEPPQGSFQEPSPHTVQGHAPATAERTTVLLTFDYQGDCRCSPRRKCKCARDVPGMPCDENEILVYGSNTTGTHGRGAALVAWKSYAAERGRDHASGLCRRSYGIVCKDMTRPYREQKQSISIPDIERGVNNLLQCAAENTWARFFVAPFACRNAGYEMAEIANLFQNKELPSNLVMNSEFAEYLAAHDDHIRLMPHNRRAPAPGAGTRDRATVTQHNAPSLTQAGPAQEQARQLRPARQQPASQNTHQQRADAVRASAAAAGHRRRQHEARATRQEPEPSQANLRQRCVESLAAGRARTLRSQSGQAHHAQPQAGANTTAQAEEPAAQAQEERTDDGDPAETEMSDRRSELQQRRENLANMTGLQQRRRHLDNLRAQDTVNPTQMRYFLPITAGTAPTNRRTSEVAVTGGDHRGHGAHSRGHGARFINEGPATRNTAGAHTAQMITRKRGRRGLRLDPESAGYQPERSQLSRQQRQAGNAARREEAQATDEDDMDHENYADELVEDEGEDSEDGAGQHEELEEVAGQNEERVLTRRQRRKLYDPISRHERTRRNARRRQEALENPDDEAQGYDGH